MELFFKSWLADHLWVCCEEWLVEDFMDFDNNYKHKSLGIHASETWRLFSRPNQFEFLAVKCYHFFDDAQDPDHSERVKLSESARVLLPMACRFLMVVCLPSIPKISYLSVGISHFCWLRATTLREWRLSTNCSRITQIQPHGISLFFSMKALGYLSLTSESIFPFLAAQFHTATGKGVAGDARPDELGWIGEHCFLIFYSYNYNNYFLLFLSQKNEC